MTRGFKAEVVCVHHRRWVGLSGGHQFGVAQEYVDAALVFKKLRRRKRIDTRLYLVLVDALTQVPSGLSLPGAESEAFIDAVRLAAHLTRQDFLGALFAHPSDYRAGWERVNEMVRNVLGRDDKTVVRAVWLYLRPTFAALRHAWVTQTPYEPFHLHDLRVSARIADA
ncbi:hypothetical protein ACPPVQ_18855 [Diaminobutyricibacter sp. McL0618]|uniref:hypothetical protein n=1 Tax=Leifsonia sp. McL0618 TaxID=3415677 RepID=UPI003CEA3EF0